VLRGAVKDGVTIAEAKKVEGAAIFAYGSFITVAINFFLLALVIFLMVKAINALKRKEAEKIEVIPPVPSAQEVLLSEIRDLLKKNA
jgi:large conductance mechanosensitive channel